MPDDRVLLVAGDDDLTLQMAELLFEAGYVVEIARSAQRAIEKLVECDRLSAVILDGDLPGAGFSRVLDAIAAEADLMSLPVVLLSPGEVREVPQGAWAAVDRKDRFDVLLMLNQLRAAG